MPEGGALLTAQWQFLYPPLLYLQECEDFRPDLEVWGVRLMEPQLVPRAQSLERNPDLAAQTRDRVGGVSSPLLTRLRTRSRRAGRPGVRQAAINEKADAFIRTLFRGLISSASAGCT